MRTWDVLVPTFYARTPRYLELLDQFEKQMRPGVRLLVARSEHDPAGMAAKQQKLLEASDADYVSLCADDTRLHPQFVELIHDAMQSDPDVVGFSFQLWNHAGPCAPEQVHSIAFARCPSLHWPGLPELGWGTEFCDLGGWMPVKRSIAIRASYVDGLLPGWDWDAHWTRQVLRTGLLRREVYLNEVLVMPQRLDPGFHGEWQESEATPNPERPFVKYV